MKRVGLVVVLGVASAALSACNPWWSVPGSRSTGAEGGASRILHARRVGPGPGIVLSPGPPGTRLPTSEIGARSAAVDGVVYGLADRGRLTSVAYPAISRDHGRTWRVDGPCFYYAAAQGPSFVSKVGAFSARSAYIWGPFANLIRVTKNGGRTWWETDMPDGVDRLVRRGRDLLAMVGQSGQRRVYASADGGFTWRPAPRAALALP